jgi:hypothetical protein
MRTIAALGLLLLSGIYAPKGFATTIAIVSHRQEYRQARAVFVGTVISVADASYPSFRGYMVRFRVDKRWKGPSVPELNVRSDQGFRGCGPRFEVGEKYLVYALIEQEQPDDPPELAVDICSRSRRLDRHTSKDVREYKELNSMWFRLWSHVPL